jgi:hypothetical protein
MLTQTKKPKHNPKHLKSSKKCYVTTYHAFISNQALPSKLHSNYTYTSNTYYTQITYHGVNMKCKKHASDRSFHRVDIQQRKMTYTANATILGPTMNKTGPQSQEPLLHFNNK